MDFKAVELQIAVPRTSDASRMQQDHLQRHAHNQHTLEHQVVQDAAQERKRSSGIHESTQTSIKDGEHASSNNESRKHGPKLREEDKDKPADHPAEHPYKGLNIDFSL
ncbi:hypothetical protein J2Z69_002134 [Paenibacillus shirakamiensis]|uniref:Uncharacterized protein n=1 Tax=Paenibacillus shirakamiensis TaxID=1265935 RepID=A0ABS4JIY8_9BACL|nr:hypothetical protein [Paenibacillus shirakamiensis]MBP2001091.1 hypothetical protein [Paenibacillus shirakamiensis]